VGKDLEDSDKARLAKLASEGQQRKADETGDPEDRDQASRMQSAADRMQVEPNE